MVFLLFWHLLMHAREGLKLGKIMECNYPDDAGWLTVIYYDHKFFELVLFKKEKVNISKFYCDCYIHIVFHNHF